MKDKILYTVTDAKIIEDLKKRGIKNFVYPLSFFCVGIPKTFKIEEIEEDGYLLINRILDTKAVDDLKTIIKNLPSNIKGIIFEDPSLFNILKDINVEKILYNSHFTTNYKSVNYYFDYVDEIIISTDITENEIDEIIKNSKKEISLFTFGLIPAMYSRRTLLSNYQKHYNIEENKIMNIENGDKRFIGIENEYGTVMYHYPYFNGLKLHNKKAKYYFYFPLLIDGTKQLDILDGNLRDIEVDDGFLNTPTIYKLKER